MNVIDKIIKSYSPRGRFYCYDNASKKYIAVDNTTGDAWQEEFDTLKECLEWLGGPAISDTQYKALRELKKALKALKSECDKNESFREYIKGMDALNLDYDLEDLINIVDDHMHPIYN